MANHKSALKRIRQNKKRRARNKAIRSRLRTSFNKFDAAIEAGDVTVAEQALRDTQSELQRAASKGVIPRARAARKTGRLAVQLDKMRAAQ